MKNIESLVCNGLLRIDGITADAQYPFEAPRHGMEHDDFHILEMVDYVGCDINVFISKALELLEERKTEFAAYRGAGCRTTLHIAMNFSTAGRAIPPELLGALSDQRVFLEIVSY